MKVDILSEHTMFGLWRSRAVSFTYEKTEPTPPGGLDVEAPTYDYGAVRWFYSRDPKKAEDKAIAWARRQACPRERGNVTTRTV